ncbi:MAG: fumarate hydratase [Desulfohalobiaceae bacterium]|nr:fumarate hydratase [Desulfohalobiaceae bacterium]
MHSIQAETIQKQVRDMVVRVSRNLPRDVVAALQRAREEETDEGARQILGELLDNAELARDRDLPLCQDTGVGVFFVEHGEDCRVEGDSINNVLERALAQAYEEGLLRKSMCHPLTRQNTGDNTPALIHTDLVPGSGITIRFMAKGGGSENMSRCTMLTPAQGWEGIKEFVLDRVATAGPNPCPPTIVGVGVGGSFDQAPLLAKKSLFRPLDQEHPDPEIAEMERELLDEINALGIGPMGLGGRTTSLGLRMEMAPCHIASLPLAVNVQCHSSRHEEVVVS